MPSLSKIIIGKYSISTFINYKGEWAIGLSDNNLKGEGMETSIKKLEEALDKFYQEEF